MLSNDATIQNIKHEILYEVAKLAEAFAAYKEGLKKKRTNWHTRCFLVLKQDSAVVYIKKEKLQDNESAWQKANVQQKVTIRVPIT